MYVSREVVTSPIGRLQSLCLENNSPRLTSPKYPQNDKMGHLTHLARECPEYIFGHPWPGLVNIRVFRHVGNYFLMFLPGISTRLRNLRKDWRSCLSVLYDFLAQFILMPRAPRR